MKKLNLTKDNFYYWRLALYWSPDLDSEYFQYDLQKYFNIIQIAWFSFEIIISYDIVRNSWELLVREEDFDEDK